MQPLWPPTVNVMSQPASQHLQRLTRRQGCACLGAHARDTPTCARHAPHRTCSQAEAAHPPIAHTLLATHHIRACTRVQGSGSLRRGSARHQQACSIWIGKVAQCQCTVHMHMCARHHSRLRPLTPEAHPELHQAAAAPGCTSTRGHARLSTPPPHTQCSMHTRLPAGGGRCWCSPSPQPQPTMPMSMQHASS